VNLFVRDISVTCDPVRLPWVPVAVRLVVNMGGRGMGASGGAGGRTGGSGGGGEVKHSRQPTQLGYKAHLKAH